MVKQVLRLIMAAVVIISSGHGFRIEGRHRNQLCKIKLLLHKPLLSLLQSFKTVVHKYNKTEYFSYRVGCGVSGRSTHIE